MKTTPLICAALSALLASAADRFDVAVCNMDNVSAAEISRGEADAAYVIGAMGITISWSDCSDLSLGNGSEHRFIVRLRPQAVSTSGGGVETMGMAYVTGDAPRVYADIYMEGVQRFAQSWNVDPQDLLGYAIAHELGHLLLGPRHASSGLMCALWSADDLHRMQQRGLKFTVRERASIRRELHGKAPGAALAVTR